MPLIINDVVTVISEDTMYFEQQGEVVEVVNDNDPDGPIGVRFGIWCSHLFDAFHEANQTTVRLLEAELRKDPDWTLEIKTIRLFGKEMWHSLFSRGIPLDRNTKCQTENCIHFCDERCLINIWGSVYEIDLCSECAKQYHGMMGESWPSKPLTRAVA
jgi:hypothetical protein